MPNFEIPKYSQQPWLHPQPAGVAGSPGINCAEPGFSPATQNVASITPVCTSEVQPADLAARAEPKTRAQLTRVSTGAAQGTLEDLLGLAKTALTAKSREASSGLCQSPVPQHPRLPWLLSWPHPATSTLPGSATKGSCPAPAKGPCQEQNPACLYPPPDQSDEQPIEPALHRVSAGVLVTDVLRLGRTYFR